MLCLETLHWSHRRAALSSLMCRTPASAHGKDVRMQGCILTSLLCAGLLRLHTVRMQGCILGVCVFARAEIPQMCDVRGFLCLLTNRGRRTTRPSLLSRSRCLTPEPDLTHYGMSCSAGSLPIPIVCCGRFTAICTTISLLFRPTSASLKCWRS